VQDSFYKYYRKPNIFATENVHKNIVFIYAESLERTYFDKSIFPGLIKGLRELEAESTYFTNIKQVVNTGWTLAGMTASQCGIPLVTPSHGNSMSGMDKFLSSAVCIGDLLNDNGYHLNYMGGASLDFAGKGKLYKTHGFTNVIGRDELLTKLENEDYQSGWGLYDDSLLEMGYKRFVDLSEAGDKFGLFLLTLDTHHPNGRPSESCKGKEYKDASNEILNAVACSDYLISNFIKKITTSKYADNTLIVLTSDHLAMRNTASDLLESKERSNLFMIIDPAKEGFTEISTVGSTLDVGATLLPFLGYSGDLGLGRNLLNEELLEKDRLFIHSNLNKWRQSIGSFWDFPKIQGSLKVNIDEKYVSIDSRQFGFPIFIELNRDLESTLKFQFDKSPGHKSLVQHRKELDDSTYFILIDKCANTKELDELLDEDGFCIMAGEGKKYTTIGRLEKNITYTYDEIRNLLGLAGNI
jgi:phosphoglycerol transferase